MSDQVPTAVSVAHLASTELDDVAPASPARRYLWVGVACVTLVAWLFIMLSFRGQPGDDPYITYRYAENIASGRGFVFNPGEYVQSTTTPLYALVLAAGGALGLDIPTLGYWLSGLALLVLAACMASLTAEVGPSYLLAGLLASVLTFLHPVTTYGLGTEMPLLMALAWGSWLAAARERWNWSALLAGLAAVTRGDGLLVGVSLAAVYVWTHRAVPIYRWPWGAAVVYVAVVAPWYIFAWAYFGSPLPATLGAKLAQGSTPGTVSFFEGLGFFWPRSLSNLPVVWLSALILVVVGIVAMLAAGRRLVLPLVWVALFITAFSLLHVPRYPWYYSPLVPVAMLALVLGAGYIYASLVRGSGAHWSGWLAALGVASVIFGAIYLYQDVQAQRPTPGPHALLYMDVGRWLKENTPAYASVGAEEVGLLGYFSDRRVIDFVGLIQPDVAEHRARGDNLWAVQIYNPDYIVALPAWLAAVGSDPWIVARYAAVRTFEETGGERVTLLRRTGP